jgi:hypothetical protein
LRVARADLTPADTKEITMRYVGAALAVTFVSGIQLSACSSSSGPPVTSLASDKTFADLTKEERRQYCEDEQTYMSSRVSKDDRRKIDCSSVASAAGGGGAAGDKARAACQTAYRACVAVPAAEPQSSCDPFVANADGCSATVGEASACAAARADAEETLASKADDTCKSLGQTSGNGHAQETKTPDACVRIQALCPKLFVEVVPGTLPPPSHG